MRPDGVDLRWRQIGVLDVIADPQLPFFVQWLSPAEQHPSAGGSPVAIERVEMCGDSQAIKDWLTGEYAGVRGDIEVEWVDADQPGIVAVWFSTPNGSVRID